MEARFPTPSAQPFLGGVSAPVPSSQHNPQSGPRRKGHCSEHQPLHGPHDCSAHTLPSIRMAVHHRGKGGNPLEPPPPPPPGQSDHRGKKRNLQKGESGWAIFGTQFFESQIPPPPPTPTAPLRILPPGGGGLRMLRAERAACARHGRAGHTCTQCGPQCSGTSVHPPPPPPLADPLIPRSLQRGG